jgi:hypothetical protein
MLLLCFKPLEQEIVKAGAKMNNANMLARLLFSCEELSDSLDGNL